MSAQIKKCSTSSMRGDWGACEEYEYREAIHICRDGLFLPLVARAECKPPATGKEPRETRCTSRGTTIRITWIAFYTEASRCFGRRRRSTNRSSRTSCSSDTARPPTFNWDIMRDEQSAPIKDDPLLEDYNVEERLRDFVAYHVMHCTL